MNASLQSMALSLYRGTCLSGLLRSEPGRRLFEWWYDLYKALFEAGEIRALAAFVQPGASVVDVGANIGFFTRRFAAWVNRGGRVLALEPEPVSFERLTLMITRRRLDHLVEPIRAAADDQVGPVHLLVDPFHPAGHALADAGVLVAAITLDHLLSQRNWPPVSLIKIDVQGAEARVLRGARETLERFHPVLFVEVDESALNGMGSSVSSVLQFLEQYGYRPYHIDRCQPRPLLDQSQVKACLRGGYTDILFHA